MTDILKELMTKYNRTTITRQELANELSVSLSLIDKLIASGEILPKTIKLGTSSRSTVRFNIIDIAQLISKGTKIWDIQK